MELRHHIVGNENDSSGTSDEFEFDRIWRWCNECEHRRTIGRRNCNPAFTRLQSSVVDEIKTKLIDVETQTAFLVSNVHVDCMNSKMWRSRIHRVRILPRSRPSTDYTDFTDHESV